MSSSDFINRKNENALNYFNFILFFSDFINFIRNSKKIIPFHTGSG